MFQEIYRAHSTNSPVAYRFFPEAQDYFNEVEDKVKIGVAEVAETIIVKSGDKDAIDYQREHIKSPVGVCTTYHPST